MNKESIDLGWKLEERTAAGIARAVGRAIREDVLPPGTKLPPIRAVAGQLQLSPATVHSAWRMLARAGVIYTDGRRGTTVADTRCGSNRYRRAREGRELFKLDLSTGAPDARLFPRLTPALKYLTTTAVMGGYMEEPEIPELIEVLRADWPYDASRFMIVDGAMDAIEQASRILVCFGDRVLIEDPVFPLLLDHLETAGAEVIGVPLDDQGMRVGPLAKALEKPVAAVVMQPRAQNPTGAALTPTRARELIDAIGATKVTIIEDDSAGPIASAPAISLGQWLPDQTLHIRSFCKSHGPDLRLASMSGPSDIIQEIASWRQHGQGWSSRLLQRILWSFLTDPDTVGQIAHARYEYQQRRKIFIAALQERGIHVAGSDGYNIWVPVADETAALVQLASQGIGAAAGAPFLVNESQQAHIRVTIGSLTKDYAELARTIAMAARAQALSGGR